MELLEIFCYYDMMMKRVKIDFWLPLFGGMVSMKLRGGPEVGPRCPVASCSAHYAMGSVHPIPYLKTREHLEPAWPHGGHIDGRMCRPFVWRSTVVVSLTMGRRRRYGQVGPVLLES